MSSKPTENEGANDVGDSPAATKGGFAALVGRPNVGKSTLLNALLRQPLAIVTDRPGTTRSTLLGVYVDSGVQIGFIDTPGILQPKTALHRVLLDQTEQALTGLDVACLVVEANSKGTAHPEDRSIYEKLRQLNLPIVVACNKIDRRRDKSPLLPLLEHWSNQDGVVAAVPISALERDNLKSLVDAMAEALRGPPPFADNEVLTDRPVRFFAAELIRKAVIERVHAEVPYGIAVQLDRYLEESGRVRIDATIVVEKDSHKAIVIGRGGSRLKEIGIAARTAIETFVEMPVVLKTWVKVQVNWTQHPSTAKAFSQETDR